VRSIACTSSGSSTTQITVPSRSSPAHTAHGLVSAILKHVEQKTVLVFRSRSASASDSETPEASLIRKYVSREADCRTDARQLRERFDQSSDRFGCGIHFSGRRQAQPACQALTFSAAYICDRSIAVDGGDDQVLQHFDVVGSTTSGKA
jgi:hypothetical protein